MHAAMGPAVHAGLRDIKCVRVPHAINPICLTGGRSSGFPSIFLPRAQSCGGIQFFASPREEGQLAGVAIAHSHTHLTA
jgi:hypothetical protein